MCFRVVSPSYTKHMGEAANRLHMRSELFTPSGERPLCFFSWYLHCTEDCCRTFLSSSLFPVLCMRVPCGLPRLGIISLTTTKKKHPLFLYIGSCQLDRISLNSAAREEISIKYLEPAAWVWGHNALGYASQTCYLPSSTMLFPRSWMMTKVPKSSLWFLWASQDLLTLFQV